MNIKKTFMAAFLTVAMSSVSYGQDVEHSPIKPIATDSLVFDHQGKSYIARHYSDYNSGNGGGNTVVITNDLDEDVMFSVSDGVPVSTLMSQKMLGMVLNSAPSLKKTKTQKTNSGIEKIDEFIEKRTMKGLAPFSQFNP